MGVITLPSPHISIQTLAVTMSPRVQLQLASTEQVASHPSPILELPSSQYPITWLTTIPSPQISVQTLAVEISPNVQEYPVSIPQF